MFAAAIFDMDGLLIDSERAIMAAWLNAARMNGINLTPEDYAQAIGITSRESEAILTTFLGGRRAYQAVADQAELLLRDSAPDAVFPIKRGASELLARLYANGVPCAVASSSNGKEIRHRLSSVGVLHYFKTLAGGDEVARGKPDPALYALAAERLNIAPARCVAFEDSENGASAALAAGLQVVVVPDIRQLPLHIANRSFHQLNSLDDALDYVPRWFKSH